MSPSGGLVPLSALVCREVATLSFQDSKAWRCPNEVSACHPCRESWARSRLSSRAVHEESQQPEKKRGSSEGAIRIPLRASLFLFNDLGFLHVPGKSLKFLASLFSIPTAPTINRVDSVPLRYLSADSGSQKAGVLAQSWSKASEVNPYDGITLEDTVSAFEQISSPISQRANTDNTDVVRGSSLP
jgi:hypothetical protein